MALHPVGLGWQQLSRVSPLCAEGTESDQGSDSEKAGMVAAHSVPPP